MSHRDAASFHKQAAFESEKDLLKKWIEQGAAWETHRAYLPPVKVNLPEAKRPRPTLLMHSFRRN